MAEFINKNAFRLLVVWLILLAVLYSALSILRHNHFQSGGFDLGLYDQAVWQYAHFLKPYNTIKVRHILGDHLTLTLPLVAPLYWLWEDVRILLIFQAFWLSFSSLAIYQICRLKKFSPLTSLNLSFIYSLFYGFQQIVYFDFHPVMMGVGLIPWLVYFLESQKKKLFWPCLIILLLTQENMGLALTCLGIIYFFHQKHRRMAFFFVGGGLLWSLLAARIISHFSNTGFQYWPQISLSPQKLIPEFYNSSEKRQSWLYSLSWFSFLPLFSPGAMLAVLFDLGQYFLTGPEFSRMWSPFMHHRAILGPFLILGVIEVFTKLRQHHISLKVVSLLMVFISLGLQYVFHFPLNKLSKPIYWRQESWMTDNRALIASVPTKASIASQQNLIPYLSHRQEIYLVYPREHDFDTKPCGQISCWWLDFAGQPEYLVVDLRPNQWLTQALEKTENFTSAVKNMEKAGRISLVTQVNDAKLYQIFY